MIKSYKQFNESLRDKLVGPTEEEILDNYKVEQNFSKGLILKARIAQTQSN